MADPHSTRSSKLPKATTLGSGLDQASPPSPLELPELHSIPELIADESVSMSDINSILFIIDELSIPDKARALMASLMPVWLATQLPVDDRAHEYFHNGLAAICRFCDFPPTGYDPRPYTAVSPVPPGTILPPGLSPTRVTDDRDMDTDSDGGPPAAPDVPMIVPARASTEHLRTLTPQPEKKGKMKEAPPHLTAKPAPAPKAPPPTPSAPQKAPTFYAAAAATSRPAKPMPQGAGKARAQTSAKPPKPTLPPPPAQPCAEPSWSHARYDPQDTSRHLGPWPRGCLQRHSRLCPNLRQCSGVCLQVDAQGEPGCLCRTGPSRDQLSAASHLLTSAVAASLPDVSARISSRLNVRWGKVLVNGVPTGVLDDSPAAHSPSACLQDLLENNPSLRPLSAPPQGDPVAFLGSGPASVLARFVIILGLCV